MKRNIIKIGLIIFLGITAVGLFQYGRLNYHPIVDRAPADMNVSITIENLYAKRPVTIPSGYTAMQFLEKLDKEDPNLKLELKEYSGLGTLVQGMAGMDNGKGDKYWQYRVNSIMPQVGAAQYILKNGDFIEWVFEKSEF